MKRHSKFIAVTMGLLCLCHLSFASGLKFDLREKLPAVLNSVDLTSQSAAVLATTLYTPTVTGFYRISTYLKVTTAGSVSSTLGGLTITYTDGVDSVAQSTTIQMQNSNTGASGPTNAGNVTSTKLMGATYIYALTGVPIQYAIAYVSNAANSMVYEAHIKIEAM